MKAITLIFSLLFVLVVKLYGQGHLVTYPTESNALTSANYTVFVNDTPVVVYVMGDKKDVSYAHFAFAGKVTVRIRVSATVNKYNLSPHGYDIVSAKSGQDITFTLDRPRKLLLSGVNSLVEELCILADPLEDNAPKLGDANVVNVLTTGIDSTGVRNGLSKINTALAALPSGGILYFPPGRYTVGGDINMKSNKSIYLAGGAVLQASSTAELRIIFSGANNANLLGRGSIDGRGDLHRPKYNGEGGNTILYCNSSSDNCRIEDVIIKGAVAWTAIVMHTKNWTVYNMKIVNAKTYTNRDSWDPHSAVNMMVDNVFLYGDDDAIAYSVLSDNLNLNSTIRNSVLYSAYGATIRIGPWIGENTKNLRIENNDHVQGGINEYTLAFWVGGAISDVKYLGNRVEVAQFGLTLMRTNWNDHYAGPQSGSVENVVFDRLTVEKVLPCTWDGHFSQFEGPNSTNFVKNISFKNFYQKGKLMTSKTAADLNLKGPNVSDIIFDKSTTPVVNINATNLFAFRTGTETGKFTVSRSGGSKNESLTVKYAIRGTAVNGTDYDAIFDSVVIPAGSNEAQIEITPNSTNTDDFYKTVFLSLSSSNDFILGPNYHAVVTISNNGKTEFDNESPSKPLGLSASAITNSSCILSWNSSDDNVGTSGYRIFRNNVFLKVTTKTTDTIVGLAAANEYLFTVKAIDASGNLSIMSDELIVNTLSTGVTEEYLNKLKFYPNPVINNQLTVDFTDTGISQNSIIQITNINGSLVYETNIINTNKSTINLPDSLASGIYIISFKNEKIFSASKILIE